MKTWVVAWWVVVWLWKGSPTPKWCKSKQHRVWVWREEAEHNPWRGTGATPVTTKKASQIPIPTRAPPANSLSRASWPSFSFLSSSSPSHSFSRTLPSNHLQPQKLFSNSNKLKKVSSSSLVYDFIFMSLLTW